MPSKKKNTSVVSVVHDICCGLDVHKKMIVACLVVRPAKAGVSSGSQSRPGNRSEPCSLDGRCQGNRSPEAHRQSHHLDGERVSGP
jgi:hypothetical protein